MLEPRRIAAVSAARWMAHLLGEESWQDRRLFDTLRQQEIGRYAHRGRHGRHTHRRIQADPTLEGVEMVIFDEFHERSLHADLALALCLDARRNLRDDLKILVMSATLDCGPSRPFWKVLLLLLPAAKPFLSKRDISSTRVNALSRPALPVQSALH